MVEGGANREGPEGGQLNQLRLMKQLNLFPGDSLVRLELEEEGGSSEGERGEGGVVEEEGLVGLREEGPVGEAKGLQEQQH